MAEKNAPRQKSWWKGVKRIQPWAVAEHISCGKLDNFGAPSPLDESGCLRPCQVTAARLNADYLTGPSEQASQRKCSGIWLRPLQLHMLHHLQLSFETSLLMAAASSNWNGYWQIPHAEKVPSAMDIPVPDNSRVMQFSIQPLASNIRNLWDM